MNAVQILVTVALVGAGLLLYDTLRAADPVPAPPPAPSLDRPAVESSSPEPPPERVGLQGVGLEVLSDRLGDVEARLEALEDAWARGGASASSSRGERPASPTPFQPRDSGGREASDFTESEIAWFRALSEEVLRIRREESEIRSIQAQLDRIRPDLQPVVREELIDATRAYRAEKREVLGKALSESWPIERRQQALQIARDGYRDEVERIAPGESEAILQRFGNFPGQRADLPFDRNR